MDWIWIWVAVVAVSLIIEFITMEMVSVWTAIGGIVALVLAALDVRFEIQLVVFFAVTIVLLLSLRKVAMKYLLKNNNTKIGTDSIIGSTHKLLTPITEETRGTIKISGITWSVTTADKTELSAETMVEVLRVEGNKLVVKKVKEKE